MEPPNTICLWFDKNAHEAARFYAATSDEEMHAALDINIPNYASALVTTNEIVGSILSFSTR